MKSGQTTLRKERQTPSALAPANPIHLAKRLEAPTASGWHSHRNAQWVWSSDGIVVLETEEGRWVALPGQALIVESHAFHALSWYGARVVETVYMEPGTARFEPGITCRSMTVSALLGAAVGALIEEPHPYRAEAESRSGLLTRLIIDEMPRNGCALFGLPSPTNRHLRRLCAHIHEDPSDSRDIDDWAAAVGISRRSLTRHLRSETGLSFIEWRQRARVIHALKLEARGMAGKQIAGATGYASVQALRSELKKIVGGSLKSLRRLHR